MLDAANGARAYYLVALEDEPRLAAHDQMVIVELSRHLLGHTETWLLESINLPGNAPVSAAVLCSVEGRLGLHGVHCLRAVQREDAWSFGSDEDKEDMLLDVLMQRGAGKR